MEKRKGISLSEFSFRSHAIGLTNIDSYRVLLQLSLAGPEETWLRDFSARSSTLNKEHRHSIKQTLNNVGMMISFLYGNVVVERLRSMAKVFTGRQSALDRLELSVTEMTQCCQTAASLQSRVCV